MNNYKNKSAFTLIELMIVIVILGLLATIIMPKIMTKPEKARHDKAKIEIIRIESALDLFYLENKRYPTTAEGLAALVKNPGGLKNYSPNGYLDKIKDPWGNPYVYIFPGTHGNKPYDLKSYGKDGENGGSDFDADIENWNMDDE